jgi:hypothetical protein
MADPAVSKQGKNPNPGLQTRFKPDKLLQEKDLHPNIWIRIIQTMLSGKSWHRWSESAKA